MLEQALSNTISFQTSANKPIEQSPSGLNKIVAIGYGQNKSQCLPISRYSLNISLVGLSKLGIASSIGLAALGHKVVAIDHDQRKVNALNQGRVSSADNKLKPLLKQVRRLNNLVASCDLHNAILSTDLSLVCIKKNLLTEFSSDTHRMTGIVEQLSATLGSKREFHLIVFCQSATDINTQNIIGMNIERYTGKTLGKDFGLCTLPINLSEQQALNDFYALANITVTTSDSRSEVLMAKLLDGFRGKVKYVRNPKVYHSDI